MRNFWNLLPTSSKLLAVAAALMIVVLAAFASLNQTAPPTPSPYSQPQKLNVLQRGIPDMPITNIEPQLDLIDKEASSDGSVIYNLKSENPLRLDQIITKGGRIIFERIYIPDAPSDPGYMTLNEVEQKYGQPDATEQGSKFWGGFLKTYIYASKGYAFIANPYTKEVFEMHTFSPMNADDYKKTFGDDISGKEPVPEGL